MTFITAELEAVRERHDAFVELGRLELVAEEVGGSDDSHSCAQTGTTERRTAVFDQPFESARH